MTQVYDGANTLVPVTVIEAGPCPVTQIKTAQSDGYEAVQIGFGAQKTQRMSKPELGHLKKAGAEPLRKLAEFRVENASEFKLGDVITVAKFSECQMVDIIGTTKGRGFQGVMKRYNFDGQPQTHGHMMHRRPGSVAAARLPAMFTRAARCPATWVRFAARPKTTRLSRFSKTKIFF